MLQLVSVPVYLFHTFLCQPFSLASIPFPSCLFPVNLLSALRGGAEVAVH